MKLKLHHVPNPDIPGGYYEPPIDPQEMIVTVDVISDASREYRQWIERNGFGGGNMGELSGSVYADGARQPFACVSYNGNIWSKESNHDRK